MTKKCIICDELKDASLFNEEHIIPESLGNSKLKIYDVCAECNSRLGSKVDCALTNNFLSEIYRNQNKIAGKNGKIPNPFRHGKTETGEPIIVDDDFKPRLVKTQLKFDEKTGKMFVKGGDINKMINAANKKLKRLKKPLLTEKQIEELKNNTKVVYENPKIQYEIIVDINKLSLAFMKIAYEFGYKYFGQVYIQDSVAQEIRKIIHDYICNDIVISDLHRYVQPMPLEDRQEFCEKIRILKAITNSKYVHMLVLSNTQDGVVLSIFIDELFAYGVRCSSGNNRMHKNITVLYPSGGIFEM